jgi:DNA-binding beta-propeller fold protein YncE
MELRMRTLIIGCVAALAAMSCDRTEAQSSSALRQVAAIALPGVDGRIDHLAFDPSTQRLFIAALGNNTVEVIDTLKNAHLRSLTGFQEPQGAAFVADRAAVAIANGDTGTLQLVDARTFETRWTIDIAGDADNVRYDAAAKRLYVAAAGGLYVVDPASGQKLGQVPIDGHPESFQLESSAMRVFANLPGLLRSHVVAADRTSMKVAAQWPTQDCGGNYPMALDETTSRLFVGCRRPAKLAMVDTRSGSFLTSVDIVGDTDDLFYDDALSRLYVIGGDGFVDVIVRKGDGLKRVGRISTRAGARTGLWVASQRRLYVAVPARSGQSAEIRVLDAERHPL